MPRRTPTQELILDLLGARWRLGEEVWTLDRRVLQQVRALEQQGLIEWKAGIVEGTILAWLTDKGIGATIRPATSERLEGLVMRDGRLVR